MGQGLLGETISNSYDISATWAETKDDRFETEISPGLSLTDPPCHFSRKVLR